VNDIIKYSDNLKLTLDSTEGSENYGLNLAFYSGSATNYISNYYNFRQDIGNWTFISVAYYDSSDISHFPQMAKFEINYKSMNITGSLPTSISLGPISFISDNMYALIKSLKIYNTFLVGAYEYDFNKDFLSLKNQNLVEPLFHLFELKENKLDCSYNLNGIIKYDCEPDLENPSISNIYCHSNCFECDKLKKYNCSCNFKEVNDNMFLGSLEFNYCYKNDYINFARAEEINLDRIKSADSTKKFTMHFWIFAYPYVNGNFKGIKMEWTEHETISVVPDSTYSKYYFECTVPSTTNSDGKFSHQMPINLGEWNFLHCAIDTKNNYFYMNTYESKYSIDYSPIYDPTGDVNFIIEDLSTNDWGVLFYRNIRLWKDCFPNVDFLSMINIKDVGYNGLLHQWNTNYEKDILNQVTELTDSHKYFIVDYNDKIGSNIVDNTKYKIFNLCEQPGQFYDKKTGNCINFINLSKFNLPNNNIEFNKIELSYNHNYGIAFWILYEDPTQITLGTDITWDYHMKISLQYHDENLFAYCYPQNYYPYKEEYLDNNDDYKDNKKRIEKVKNYVRMSVSSPSNWIWIQCFLNYQARQFYLNENEEELKNENLYNYNGENNLNLAPYGFFFNKAEKNNDSKLKITLSDYTKSKIFIRCLYLFKDYLPYNYNFRYMDLTLTKSYEFPPLLFAINFAEYVDDKIDKKKKKIINIKIYKKKIY
jgi:hypothetical protein